MTPDLTAALEADCEECGHVVCICDDAEQEYYEYYLEEE